MAWNCARNVIHYKINLISNNIFIVYTHLPYNIPDV